jgi:hypothetical protein
MNIKPIKMKIDYKIEEVRPNVFAVIVKDHYHRAMLFCRVQEFYESPNPQFRGKNFSIWDYIEWYSREHGDVFTYTFDWGGFNIPLKTAWDCYEKLREDESPYDEVMESIIRTIELKMFYKKNTRNWNAYIIGTDSTESDTFEHEVCHGLYATNKDYKKLVDEVTLTISTKDYQTFRNNLIEMGYTDKVIDDEIQAYLTTNWDYKKFMNGVSKKVCNELHTQYINVFSNF